MSLDLQFVVLYKGPEQEFEEKRALRANLELNRARTQIGLRAESEGAEASLEAVRIDFDEKPSSFMLHDLRVVSPDGDNLYLWDGSPGQLVGVGFKAVRTIQGVRIDCLDADPQLPIAFHAPLPKWVLISITVTEAVGEGAFLQPIDEVLQNQEIMHAELSRHLRAFTAAMADFTVAEEDVDQALLELRNAGVAQSSLHERRVDSLRGVLEQVLGTLASIESEAVNLRDCVAATADSSALKVLEAIRPLAIAIGAAREAADVSYQALRVGIAEGDAQADLLASQ
jgi:hypothetical protein